jgi:hypothetical protein
MKFALMSTMIAFLAFAALVVWFRYDLERVVQRISATHIQKAARRVMACVALPAVFFFQLPEELEIQRQRTFMYGGYIAAWVIYSGYLLILANKRARLKKEASELAVEV